MAEELAETTHFGLTRVGSGEPFSKNGFSFSDLDRVKLDRLIWAALTHRHDGGVTLGDPTIAPTMVAHPAGGHLPAATTYYYRTSYVDEHGLETAASPEGIVTTPDPISPPTSFAGTVETSGGTVVPGIYAYMITFTDAYGGETTPSAINNVQVTGDVTNRIRLNLPDASTDATGYGIYRARPGQSAFYLVGTVTSPTTVFYDTGLIEDQTIQAPLVNSTSAANSVDVTIPGAFIPLGCVSWRIYRATASGGYDGYSLVHEVTEGVTETSTIPVGVWTDTGDVQLQGFPLETSSCIPPSAIISGSGGGTLTTPPQALSAFLPGSPSNAQVVTVTSTPVPLRPVRFTAHFQTAPTEAGVTVTFRLSDGTGNQLDLPCSPTTHASGDPAGYFHVETPTVTGAQYEAEIGALLGSAAVIDDINASSQHAVLLSGTGDGLRISLGSLDPGTYQVNATLRVSSYDSSTTNDLLIEMVNMTANTVLASSSITLNTTSQTAYMQIVGPSAAVPGGAVIALRITKDSASTQSYAIDSVKISSSHTDLSAGPITIETLVSGGTSTAADANVAVWFYQSDTSGSGSGGGTFVPGADEPSLANQYTASANCGVRLARSDLTVIGGIVHASGTTKYTKTLFTGRVIVDSGSPTFTDCMFVGGMPTGTEGAQVDCRAADVAGAVAEYCTFIQDSPNAFTDSIIGHHWTARQCVVEKTVDGFGSYNTHGPDTDVHVEGCYVNDLSWFYPDPTGVHTDGTHNDCLQHQGGNGLWLAGNALHGYIEDETGNSASNNPGGSSPDYNQSGQIVMVQLNVSSVSDVHIIDNWIYGGANGISVRNSSTSGYTMGDVEIKRNRWMDNGQTRDGSHINYIRCDSGQSINGVTYGTGYYDMPSGADANVWGFTGTDAFGVSHTIGDPIANGIRVP